MNTFKCNGCCSELEPRSQGVATLCAHLFCAPSLRAQKRCRCTPRTSRAPLAFSIIYLHSMHCI
jgi:hypothetical protein